MSWSSDRLPQAFGPYVLLEGLGAGTYGTTHLARERGSPLPLVIKRLRDDASHREDLRARLRHEGAIAVNINNQHVAHVFDIGAVKTVPFLAMEYVDGWQLTEVMRTQAQAGMRWSPGGTIALITAMLDGVAALHEAVDPSTGASLGVIHRDLSPNNVMLGSDGRPVLIDLGLGRSTLRELETQTDVVAGTPGYMAPEQILARLVDHRADLYAIAVITFELLTMQRYIANGEIASMLRAACDDPYRPPSHAQTDLSPKVDLVLKRALAVNPAERYPTARALSAALASVITPRPADIGAGVPAVLLAAHAERAMLRQMKLQAPLPEESDASSKTEIFARTSRRAPTIALFSPVDAPGTLTMRTALRQPADPASGPIPPWSPPREASARPALIGGLAGAVVAIVTGAIGWWLFGETEAEVLPPEMMAPKSVGVVATPQVIPAPTEAPAETLVPLPPDPEPTRAPARAAAAPTAAPVTSPPARPALDPRARLESLIQRANAKKVSAPDRAAALDAVIAEASAWLMSQDEARLTAAADRLEAQLTK